MRNVSDNSGRENQKTHFVFSNLFPENRTVYEITWNNWSRAGHARDDDKMRCGACALHAGHVRLQTQPQNMQYLLLFTAKNI